MAPSGRIRKAGGGRLRKVVEDPTLLSDVKALVEPAARGDPMQPLLWTSLSLRTLVGALAEKGQCPPRWWAGFSTGLATVSRPTAK